MENASKALLISGGILFALLTLSLVAVMVNNINKMETAKDEAQEIEQLTKFNRQYEVFNKQKLYGTEIITAVNKVVENNSMALNDDDPWYINVEIETGTDEFENTVWRVNNRDRYSEKKQLTGSAIPSNIKNLASFGSIKGQIQLIPEGEEAQNRIKMNETMINFFSTSTEDLKITDEEYTYYIDSALKTFKTRIFSGTVKYNNEGRICKIEFELQPIKGE